MSARILIVSDDEMPSSTWLGLAADKNHRREECRQPHGDFGSDGYILHVCHGGEQDADGEDFRVKAKKVYADAMSNNDLVICINRRFLVDALAGIFGQRENGVTLRIDSDNNHAPVIIQNGHRSAVIMPMYDPLPPAPEWK